MIFHQLPEYVYVAPVDGQWIEIDEEDADYYPHAKCLKRNISSEGLGGNDCAERFREHRRQVQNREGSPLKREYDSKANMTWRWVEVNGKFKWVERDWSQEPPRGLWGFDSDGDDSDDEFPGEDENKQTADSDCNGTVCRSERDLTDPLPREVDDILELIDAAIERIGEFTVDDSSTRADDGYSTVSSQEDFFLDEDEQDNHANVLISSGSTTKESPK